MPDTIFRYHQNVRRVPDWSVEKNHSPESFAEHYMARMSEFESMERRHLFNEMERLRLQVENDGRLYIVAHHAQQKAAEDVYMWKWVRGWRNNVRAFDAGEAVA